MTQEIYISERYQQNKFNNIKKVTNDNPSMSHLPLKSGGWLTCLC